MKTNFVSLLALLIVPGTAVGQWSESGNLNTAALTTGGKVGIGSTTLPQQLNLNGGIGFVNQNASDKKLYSPVDGILEWMTHSSALEHGFVVSHQGQRKIYLNTNGASYLTGGRVGIGTDDPSDLVDIAGTLGVEANAGLPANADANNALNYAKKYSFRMTSSNNGLYFSLSNVFNVRKVFIQAGHKDPAYAYGMGEICINPFGGNVGIGTTTPGSFKLAVNGKIWTQEVNVAMTNPGPDYVFEEDYDLLSLAKLEAYIKQNKHLPEVPSAKQMDEEGLNLKEMNLILLKKVEELTLHLIEMKKQIEALEKK